MRKIIQKLKRKCKHPTRILTKASFAAEAAMIATLACLEHRRGEFLWWTVAALTLLSTCLTLFFFSCSLRGIEHPFARKKSKS